MTKAVLARVQTMVLCDDFEPSPDEEGVYNLFGARTEIQAGVLPYTHPRLCVYLQMSGHEGETPCQLLMAVPGTEDFIPLGEEQTFQLHGPLQIVAKVMVVEDCEFPVAGIYWFRCILGSDWPTNDHW